MEHSYPALPRSTSDGSAKIIYRMYSDNKLIKVVRKRPFSRSNVEKIQHLQLPEIGSSPSHNIIKQNRSFNTNSLINISNSTDNPKAILNGFFKSIILKHSENIDKKKSKENLDKTKHRNRIKNLRSKSYFIRKDEILGDFKKEQEIIRRKIIDHKKLRPDYLNYQLKPRKIPTIIGECTSHVENLKSMLAKIFSGKKVSSSFDSSQTMNNSFSLDNLKKLCNAAQSSISNMKKRIDHAYPDTIKQAASINVPCRNLQNNPYRNGKKELLLARLKNELLRDFDVKEYKI